MSLIGENLLPNNYSIPYKYIAVLDSEYFVKNDMELWKILCNNGLFDVWVPDAPYKRFEDSKKRPSNFRIQLIRIWQIREEFNKGDIEYASDRIDHLIPWDRSVTLEKPVIPDGEFESIKSLLIDSLKGFRTR